MLKKPEIFAYTLTFASTMNGTAIAARGREADLRACKNNLGPAVDCVEGGPNFVGLDGIDGFESEGCGFREGIGSVRRLSVAAMAFVWNCTG